ncbi:unnamed protein product [Bursaphelenchus xylophilus]|uniref:(pine wood nematode) hypothetical protein n=1 Tax=Bursaphelenchus xylophilus TaxID=6326 RepID=A0A1I7S8U3_BURXY|nr:unnamed protein product [Bursaphelenchus xylophilus]CAG9085867.1 unnamed protein product [Bursaphelenchus xylophilus]
MVYSVMDCVWKERLRKRNAVGRIPDDTIPKRSCKWPNKTKYDIVGHLPMELVEIISSCLSANDLKAMGQVNRRWRRITSGNRIWSLACGKAAIEPVNEVEDDHQLYWKYNYFHHRKIRRNWTNLTYTREFTFTLKKKFIASTDEVNQVYFHGSKVILYLERRVIVFCTEANKLIWDYVDAFKIPLLAAGWHSKFIIAEQDCILVFFCYRAVLFCLKTGKIIWEDRQFDSHLFHIHALCRNHIVMRFFANGSIRVIDFASGRGQMLWDRFFPAIYCGEMSEDMLYVGVIGSRLMALDLKTGDLIASITLNGTTEFIKLIPSHGLIAVRTQLYSSSIYLLNKETLTVVRALPIRGFSTTLEVVDENFLVSAMSYSGGIRVWNINKQRGQVSPRNEIHHSNRVEWCVNVIDDLVITKDSLAVNLWRSKKVKFLRQIRGNASQDNKLDFFVSKNMMAYSEGYYGGTYILYVKQFCPKNPKIDYLLFKKMYKGIL